MKTKANPKLIAFYALVSTALHEDENTIENQMMELRRLADEQYGKDGYVVTREYRDEDWSGDILARPRLDQLRQDAALDLWEAVLIYDPDRLARRYSFQELVLDELREAGKEVHFCTRSAPKDPIEKILFGVTGLFAEYERAKIAERFRLGKLRKAKDKHIIMSEAPYGYTLVTRKGKPGDTDFVETHLVINQMEAAVVQKVFHWVGNEGLTLRKVVKRLQEQGIKPRKNKDGVWGTTTLSTMLKRETYIGQAYYGMSTAVTPKKPWKKDEKYRKVKKTSRVMKPKKDWVPIPAPVILGGEEGKALFERTQQQLLKNFEDCKRNKKNNYLLAERIRCECGCSRTGEGPKNGKYLYYRCSSRVKRFPLPTNCPEKGINARIADEKVWTKLVQLASSKPLLERQIKGWQSRQKTKAGTTGVDIDILQKEMTTLKKQEQRYQVAYGGGAIELSQLSELTAPIKEKLADIEQQIIKARGAEQEQDDNSVLSVDELEMLTLEAKETLKDLSFEQKRAIVLDTVDQIVGVPGRLKVNGFMPVVFVSPYQYDLCFSGASADSNYYVKFKTSGRNCWSPQRRQIDTF